MVAAQPGRVCLIPVAYGSSTAWSCVLACSTAWSLFTVGCRFDYSWLFRLLVEIGILIRDYTFVCCATTKFIFVWC